MRTKRPWRMIILCLMAIPTGLHAQKGPRFQITSGNNRFALELYQSLAAPEGNVFLSPASVSMALAMVYEGARGKTELEIKEALHFPEDRETRRIEFAEWIRILNEEQQGDSLIFGNALWTSKEFPIEEEFLNLTKKFYSAEIQSVDFRGQPELCRKEINTWIEQETDTKIVELLPPGSILNATILVLTNAVYFNAMWQYPFKKELTRNEDFHVSKSDPVNVPFMEQQGKFNYTEDDMVSVLELPYRSGQYSMLFFLPKKDMDDFELSLSDDNYYYWLGRMLPCEMESIRIPKFKFQNSVKLKEPLHSMGMTDAFTQGSANFSGMGTSAICLDEIYHKAFIDVNEEGTEAAAATGAVVVQRGAVQKKQFIANRPFLFVIRENSTHSILFIGRVANPAQ